MKQTTDRPDGRLVGIDARVSPGSNPKQHLLIQELQGSTLIMLAAGSEPEAVAELASYVAQYRVHLIELGAGWSHTGVGLLLDTVGGRTLVATRWFPNGSEPDSVEGKIRRGVLFFCTTPETRGFFETPEDQIWFEGVLSADDGLAKCQRLVDDFHVQVIELCTDWGYSGAAQAQSVVGPAVKIGVSLHQAADSGIRSKLYVPPEFDALDAQSLRELETDVP